MKTTMVLLVSAVVLLSPALAMPHPPTNANLKKILDLAWNYTSLPKVLLETFVEDHNFNLMNNVVCQPKFLCQVEKILRLNFAQHKSHFEEIVRNLVVHNTPHKKVCDKVQLRGESEGTSIQLQALLQKMISCIQHINFKFSSNSTATP